MARDANGRFWIPTTDGVVWVDPASVASERAIAPPVIVKQISTDGRTVTGPRPSLAAGTDRLTFDYTAIHLDNPGELVFRYRLNGHDADWVPAGKARSATYTNLPADVYTFEVQTAIVGEAWGRTASVTVTLLPEWHETWWFYVISAFGVLGVMLGLYGWRVRSLTARQSHLETLVNERTRSLAAAKLQTEEQARRLQEMDEAKSRFFANISHEFRTPLTLIRGPIQDRLELKSGNADDAELYSGVVENADRLLDLVNQLLDLAKLESGAMSLDLETADVVEVIESQVRLLAPLAERHQIDLTFQSVGRPIAAEVDRGKVEMIVVNVVSNALKFTPAGGKVWVSVERDSHDLCVTVKDTGPGIHQDDLSLIFDRFSSVQPAGSSGNNGRDIPGTGIGLALAKEFAELHGGEIGVTSDVGFGSTFAVRLPIGTPAELTGMVPAGPPEVTTEPARADHDKVTGKGSGFSSSKTKSRSGASSGNSSSPTFA